MSKMQIDIKLPIIIEKKEKWYVSSCHILDMYSQGDTENEAKNNIIEALTIFLQTCIEHGTIEAVLKDCGFKVTSIAQDTEKLENYVNIPIKLISNLRECSHCHV